MRPRAGLSRYSLRFAALGYLVLLLAIPVGMVFYRMFEDGLAAVWDELTSPAFVHALKVTLMDLSRDHAKEAGEGPQLVGDEPPPPKEAPA